MIETITNVKNHFMIDSVNIGFAFSVFLKLLKRNNKITPIRIYAAIRNGMKKINIPAKPIG